MWSCLPIHQLSISFIFSNTCLFFFLLLCTPTDILISSQYPWRLHLVHVLIANSAQTYFSMGCIIPRETKHLVSGNVNNISTYKTISDQKRLSGKLPRPSSPQKDLAPRIGNSPYSCSVLTPKNPDGNISGTKRVTGDQLVSKRPNFQRLFRSPKKILLDFWISVFILDLWPYLGNKKSYRRSACV